MNTNKTITPRYTFDKTTFVKFIDRTDFKLAKYNDISLDGFSCFCNKPIEIGEKMRVEINLKMISGGLIDDLVPHIATSEVIGKETINGNSVFRFKFIEFAENTFDNLSKVIDYLDQKEKLIAFTDISIDNRKAQDTISEIVKDMSERIKKGQITLPVLPKIVQEIKIVTNNPDATNDDIAAVIEKDAVIAIKIISAANSIYYRGRSHIVTVKETIPRLGIKETQNLVLTIATKSLYNTKREQYVKLLEKLWSHSLACALNAKAIAQELECKNGDDFFTIGLVHDIGQTLLIKILSEMTSTKTFKTNDIIGSTNEHAVELSEVILKHWNFSDDFTTAVVQHKNHKFDETSGKSALIVNVANNMTYNIGYGINEEHVDLANLESAKILKLLPEKLYEINEKTRLEIEDFGNSF